MHLNEVIKVYTTICFTVGSQKKSFEINDSVEKGSIESVTCIQFHHSRGTLNSLALVCKTLDTCL